MHKLILISIFLLLSAFRYDVHPLHVSVTEINYDEKDKALEIMSRIFIDDLETTFRKAFNSPELDILHPKDKNVDDMLKTYIGRTFGVTLDGKRQPLNYLGYERDGDAFVVYVEVVKVKKWKTIEVRNSFLTEQFDDQSNLVHVTVKETVRSLRLHKDEPSGRLTFE
jgi:hypothetical protein